MRVSWGWTAGAWRATQPVGGRRVPGVKGGVSGLGVEAAAERRATSSSAVGREVLLRHRVEDGVLLVDVGAQELAVAGGGLGDPCRSASVQGRGAGGARRPATWMKAAPAVVLGEHHGDRARPRWGSRGRAMAREEDVLLLAVVELVGERAAGSRRSGRAPPGRWRPGVGDSSVKATRASITLSMVRCSFISVSMASMASSRQADRRRSILAVGVARGLPSLMPLNFTDVSSCLPDRTPKYGCPRHPYLVTTAGMGGSLRVLGSAQDDVHRRIVEEAIELVLSTVDLPRSSPGPASCCGATSARPASPSTGSPRTTRPAPRCCSSPTRASPRPSWAPRFPLAGSAAGRALAERHALRRRPPHAGRPALPGGDGARRLRLRLARLLPARLRGRAPRHARHRPPAARRGCSPAASRWRARWRAWWPSPSTTASCSDEVRRLNRLLDRENTLLKEEIRQISATSATSPRARRCAQVRGEGAARRAVSTPPCSSAARPAPARKAWRGWSTSFSPRFQAPVRGGEPGRHARGAHRERALRPREGRVHRRHAPARRPLRAGRRRDASSSTRWATRRPASRCGSSASCRSGRSSAWAGPSR